MIRAPCNVNETPSPAEYTDSSSLVYHSQVDRETEMRQETITSGSREIPERKDITEDGAVTN